MALAGMPDCVAHELIIKATSIHVGPSSDPVVLPKVGMGDKADMPDAPPEPGVPRDVLRLMMLVAQKHPKMIPMGAFDATIMKRMKAERRDKSRDHRDDDRRDKSWDMVPAGRDLHDDRDKGRDMVPAGRDRHDDRSRDKSRQYEKRHKPQLVEDADCQTMHPDTLRLMELVIEKHPHVTMDTFDAPLRSYMRKKPEVANAMLNGLLGRGW